MVYVVDSGLVVKISANIAFCLEIRMISIMCKQAFVSLYDIFLPKGVNANPANLKCCVAKGIPIIVMARSRPTTTWLRAIQMPPISSQIMFIMVFKQPLPVGVVSIFFPKGQSATKDSLKIWMPKGIPIMVRHITKPLTRYSKKIKMPPNRSQIIFPITLIAVVC